MYPLRSSATARLIARCTLLAARDSTRRALVPRGAAAALTAMLAADGGAGWFDLAARHAWSRAALRGIERAVLPGISTHYLVRKRWIEQAGRAALTAGTEQVVVLGAGFDTLAWRLHAEWPGVQFLELDHPATQEPKRRALGGAPNFTYVAADLAQQSLAAALRHHPGFSPDRPTLFVAEGLLMYFREEQVAALLHEIAAITRFSPRVLFTFMEASPEGRIAFRRGGGGIDWWLGWQREPFQWAIAPTRLEDFLRPLGLTGPTLAGTDELRRLLAPLGLGHLPLAAGEWLCSAVASRSFTASVTGGYIATEHPLSLHLEPG